MPPITYSELYGSEVKLAPRKKWFVDIEQMSSDNICDSSDRRRFDGNEGRERAHRAILPFAEYNVGYAECTFGLDGVEGDDEGDEAAKRRRDSADSQEAELGVAVDYQVVKAGVVSKKAAEDLQPTSYFMARPSFES